MKNRFLKREYAIAVGKNIDYNNLDQQIFTVIKNGINYWVADPFPIELDGTLYIFGEIFEYSKNKGSIGYTKLESGKFTPWKIVIREEYHLSFPNLIYINDQLYMCPEANESDSIYLYKCTKFPERWERDRVLVDMGKYVDTIFYEQDGDVFGITYRLSDEGNKLKLFKLDDCETSFSDIKIGNADPDYTRPAGKIFYDNKDKCYLFPSQIGVPVYGSGIVINKFSIDWPNMEIKPIKMIYPDDLKYTKKRKYSGVHTLNFTENYVVIDMKWYGFNIINIFFKLIRKIKKEEEYDGKR